MTSQLDVIKHWANRWRSLRAWRNTIPVVDFRYKTYSGRGRVGQASCVEGYAEIRLTGVLHHDLGTVLHELAHLAVPIGAHHNELWREAFVVGAAEALDVSIAELDPGLPISELDRQVEDAVASWLAHSGQAAVLRAIGVMS